MKDCPDIEIDALDYLATLNDEDLFDWFCTNARNDATIEKDNYYIRVGAKILQSTDTRLLNRKFRRLVIGHRHKNRDRRG